MRAVRPGALALNYAFFPAPMALRGRLLIFCGIPGSGKTTIARVVAERLPRTVLVQTDALRAMLGHPGYGAAESRFVYGGCLVVAREALRGGYTVILDGTFMLEQYRARAKSQLRRYASSIDVVHVVCDLETALVRNSARKARVPPGKVRSIHRRFEAPTEAVRVDSAGMRPVEAGAALVKMLF